MSFARPAFFLGRLAYAAFLLVTSAYCLLTFIPFTYQQVHVGELLPWLTRFVHLHPYLYWLALAMVAPTLVADLKAPKSRTPTRLFLAAAVAVGVVLTIHPLLANLANNRMSLVWSALALLPMGWLAACDWLAKGAQPWANHIWPKQIWGGQLRPDHRLAEQDDENRRVFSAAWQSAFFVSLLYAAVLGMRSLANQFQFPPRQWAWGLIWSLLSHLLLFMGIFVLLGLASAISALFAHRRKTEFALDALLAGALVWMVFRSVVFPSLSFRGWMADGLALELAVVLVAFSTAMGVVLYRAEDGPLESGLALLLWPTRFLRRQPATLRVGFFVALAALTYWLATRSAMFDWEFVVQKLVAVFVWTLSFAAFYALACRESTHGESTTKNTTLRYIAAALVLVAFVGLQKAQPRQEQAGLAPSQAAAQVEEYANYDVSFRLADELISGPRALRAAGGDASAAFYAFLAKNTDIPRSRQIKPVDINLVGRFEPTGGPKPNIFLFVIDSLRSDYLGTYNPAVTFTPAFDKFARDSVVMQNAFTHYGGTGLSEPSIWVGGMMLHDQYITPFEPMNTLKKLVDAEGYDPYVSKDTILRTVLGPSPEIHELDANIGTMHYDFCNTLDELTRTIPTRAEGQPMFVYTQPQNLHISVINREGRWVPPGVSFPRGFDAPYASRVAHIDRCFGQFIGVLKKAGMYDNSVIVVAADHGDSLGERGRWGHAYTIFPEIVRVPLIIHLPPAMKAELAYDTRAPAFLTDITPTLYYLLGQRPKNDPVLGRPLFTTTIAEQYPYQRNCYLVVSSYAPVYGVLSRDGGSLYIADGVDYRDYFFDLSHNPLGVAKPITDELRSHEQGLIRQQVIAIAKFYGLE